MRNRGSVRKLSKDEASELVARYRGGATVYDLAERFGIHRVTVSAHLRREGVAMRGRSMTAAEVNRAAGLYVGGWSTARIGEEMGFNGGTIWLALRSRGVPMRSPQERTLAQLPRSDGA